MTEFPAIFTLHTPSGPVHCCANHTLQVVGLFHHIGVRVLATAAPDDSECTNCVNEAAKERAS